MKYVVGSGHSYPSWNSILEYRTIQVSVEPSLRPLGIKSLESVLRKMMLFVEIYVDFHAINKLAASGQVNFLNANIPTNRLQNPYIVRELNLSLSCVSLKEDKVVGLCVLNRRQGD